MVAGILLLAVGAPAVIELYTSQGCSSCPAADALLAELANARTDVVALSFHVDYWNGLGWADPYSSPIHTARQRRYGQQLNGDRVYTPQAVVDGTQHCVGSDRACLTRSIASRDDKVELVLSRVGTRAVALPAHLPERATSLAAAWVQRRAANLVPRGENKGRTLAHAWVVRHLDEFSLSGRPPKLLEVPRIPDAAAERLVLVAHDNALRVVGVGVLDL